MKEIWKIIYTGVAFWLFLGTVSILLLSPQPFYGEQIHRSSILDYHVQKRITENDPANRHISVVLPAFVWGKNPFKDHNIVVIPAISPEISKPSLVIKPENKLLAFRLYRNNKRYHSIIVEAGADHDIEPALIKAVIMVESGYNEKAVSRRGAKGLMQLMPDTANAMGVEDIFDPEHNIHGGVRYIRHLIDKFDGDVELALAAYNAGSRRVKQYNGVPPFKATQIYIKKIIKYYRYFKTLMDQDTKRA